MTLSNPAQYISGRTVQEQMNSLIDYVDQRAADVALDAIASDVAQVHQDMLDADADASAAAASAAAAAGTLANAVKKTGEASQSIAGDISIAGSLTAGSISSPGNVNGATIGGSTSDMVARDIIVSGTAYIGDTEINGDLEVTESTAVIDMSGAASVLTPDSAIGSYSTKNAINAPRLKDELDNYAPMVRTTGNQTISGIKTFESKNTIIIGQPHGAPEEGQLIIKDYRTDATHTIGDPTQVSFNFGRVIFLDGNGNFGASIVFTNNAGVSTCELWLRNADGTRKVVILGSGNA